MQTTARPYKKAWPLDDALSLIREESGRHFDPVISTAFFSALPEIRETMTLFADEPEEPEESVHDAREETID